MRLSHSTVTQHNQIRADGMNTVNIRMIAMDLDGTLLKNDHRSISKASVRAIDAAHNNHIACTVATGRIFSIIPHQVRAISDIDWAVTSNGAVLYDNRLYGSKEPSLTGRHLC